MNIHAVRALFTAELKLIFRNLTVAVSAIVMPIGVCILVASRGTSNMPAAGWALPIALQITVFLGMTACVTSAGALTQRRNDLYLKRLRSGTIADPAILFGVLAPVLALTLLQCLIMIVISGFIGAGVPTGPLPLAILLIGGIAVAVLFGGAISGVTSTAEQAQTVAVPFFLLLIASAVWAGTDLATGLSTLQLALPGGAILQLAHLAYATQGDLTEAAPPVLALAAWSTAGLLLARRYFRWEPRNS